MLEIKVTIDISDRLLSTLSILAGSLHTKAEPVKLEAKAEPVKQEAKPVDMPVYVQKTVKVTENVETAKSDALTKAVEQDAPAGPQNLPVETPEPADVPKPAESVESHAAVKSEAVAEPKAETPKKASRSKKAEPKAEPVKAEPAEEKAETEDPLMPPEPTKAPEPVKEEPKADESPRADEGKGATGDVLAELTKRAIVELTEAGIDRADSNRRIREYCAKNEIKYPTFPALLNAIGYGEAIAVCKGEA